MKSWFRKKPLGSVEGRSILRDRISKSDGWGKGRLTLKVMRCAAFDIRQRISTRDSVEKVAGKKYWAAKMNVRAS
jgi:hypothetical protein